MCKSAKVISGIFCNQCRKTVDIGEIGDFLYIGEVGDFLYN